MKGPFPMNTGILDGKSHPMEGACMNPARAAYCRTFQKAFRAALPALPYREPEILTDMERISDVCSEKGYRGALVVTDPGIAELGLMEPMLRSFEDAGIEAVVYADTVANPTIANVEAARELYLDNRCQAIVGFGGGSAMDCAKAVGARIAKPRQKIPQMRGLLKILVPIPPLFAVPTTAGTGSEVTVAAVITDSETHYKYPINDFCLIPKYAVHDARVTFSLPKHITSTTGMDALTHAVEAYIGHSTSAYTREKSETAVKLIHDHLLRAYEDGHDEEARAKMLYASYCAGIAFTQSYVGYVHGVAHSLGGQYGIPHGLANAIILPHFLRAYGKACAPQLARLARICGIGPQATDTIAAANFIDWIDDMNRRMDIPRYVEGIKEADIPLMAAHADAESNPLYPVPVEMDARELAGMYYVVAGKRMGFGA